MRGLARKTREDNGNVRQRRSENILEQKSDVVLIILLVLLILNTGCVSSGGKTTTGPSPEQIDAEDAINTTIEKYNKYKGLYQNLQDEINLAETRGVDITSAGKTASQISIGLVDASTQINLAIQYYNAGQYTNANNIAQEVSNHIGSLDSLIEQASTQLKTSYDNTIADYQKKINQAATEINAASAYVQDAKNNGANVDTVITQLSLASIQLENAKNSFTNNDFNKVNLYLTPISKQTDKIKEDALYAKREKLTTLAIDEVKNIIKSTEGNKIIDEATTKKNQGKFQDAVNLLNKAIIKETFQNYTTNKDNLIKYAHDKEIQLNPDPINTMEREVVSRIDAGEYLAARNAAGVYTQQIETALEASIKIANTKNAQKALKGITYLGTKTDTIKTEQLYVNATEELKKGEYDKAKTTAEQAIAEAQKEKENFYQQIQNNTLMKIVSAILSIFGRSPPNIVFEPVDNTTFTWPQIPEKLINVDLSPPKINAEGKPETTTTPTVTLPTLKTPAEPTPIEFSLDVPKPSYDIGIPYITPITVTGTTSIKNKGDQTAHNVHITFELISKDGKKIKLNGKDSIEKDIGDLNGGSRKTEAVTFTITTSDGQNIQNQGATGRFYITSNEKTQTIEKPFTV